MIQLQRRLAKLECRAAVAEKDALVFTFQMATSEELNLALDADLDALKAAGFLRGTGVRGGWIEETGEIDGLTDQERQFLADRRRNS